MSPLATVAAVALLVGAVTVQAEEIVYNRTATAVEITAVRVVTPEIVAQAEAAPPWSAWAADRGDGRVMVRIENQAVCGATGWCEVTWRGMLGERADWPPR